MGWWLGRKSAPTDARPFVPAWLNSDSVEEGFARSCEGMTLYERKSGTWATFRGGAWEIGNVRGSSLLLGDRQVVGPQAPAIEPPAGGSVVDAEARTAIEAILDRLHQHGLIAEGKNTVLSTASAIDRKYTEAFEQQLRGHDVLARQTALS